MFDVNLDPSVLERLACCLELWSTGLSGVERSHLMALLGLGAAAIAAADAVAELAKPLSNVIDLDAFAMLSPGFADALSPAADAAHRCATAGQALAIIHGPEPDQWTVATRSLRPPAPQSAPATPPWGNQGFP